MFRLVGKYQVAGSINVLLVEDSPEDAELVLRALEQEGMAVSHHRVDTGDALLAALDDPWDLVISDFSMPGFDGLKAFDLVKQHASDTPFIFVSGVLGEERAVDAMRAGAKDYVLKDKLWRLGSVARRVLAEAENRRKRISAERELALQQRRYQTIFESAPVALLEADLEDARRFLDARGERGRMEHVAEDEAVLQQAFERIRVLTANAAAARLLGVEATQVLPASAALNPGWRDVWLHALGVTEQIGSSVTREVAIQRADGGSIDLLVTVSLAQVADASGVGESAKVVISMVDVSERNDLERQMRAAQRMEAVGRLAGGVAHDFNNVLTVIEGYAGLIWDAVPEGDPIREDVETIQEAALSAGKLIRQLLAFSRRQVSEVEVLDVNQHVLQVHKMLRRLLGEDVELVTSLAEDVWLVEIDSTHLEQVLMNLAVNARDAMPGGGTLSIETANTTLDEHIVAHKPARVLPGDYVTLSVSDSGCGMDEEVRQHMFEPFFTTKGERGGTGLGLSTVYGIVKQAGGFIWVYSEPGHGTTFKVVLPRVQGSAVKAAPKARAHRLQQGSETVLLVEDNDLVRRAAERTLRKGGYQVYAARDGNEALLLFERHSEAIDVVISDVIMPAMSGPELAERLSATRPGLRILFSSGYTSNEVIRQGQMAKGAKFLEKPYTPGRLLSKLREVLDDD
jgi:signal transduction histidine kinase